MPCIPRERGPVTVLAVWFGLAVVVGLLLGYVAHRLKGAPKGELDIGKGRDASAKDSSEQQKFASSRRSFIKTNRVSRRLWLV
jgi:hypothetical protein